jgi:hypothetical protein
LGFPEHQGKRPLSESYPKSSLSLNADETPVSSNARINDREMDGSGRKIRGRRYSG